MNKTTELKEKLEIVYNEFLDFFVEKHDMCDYELYDDYTVICFNGDYFLSIYDVTEDVINEYPKDTIFEWQSDCVQYCVKNSTNKAPINLRSYVMGLRFEHLEKADYE